MNNSKREVLKRLEKTQPRNYWNTSGKDRQFMRSAKDPDPTCEPEKQIVPCQKCQSTDLEITRVKGPAFDVKCRTCSHEMLGVHGRITKEPENEWWIDSPEHGYCFWKFIQDKSTPDGKMEPMQQNEIAKYFGCSATKIHFILKQAIAKIKAQGLDEVLKDFTSIEPTGEAIRPTITNYDSDSED
jgi:hypothetical protein